MSLQIIFRGRETTIARDLKINLERLLDQSALDPVQARFALLAGATSVGHEALSRVTREMLQAAGQSPEAIQEAAESAAIMGMLNTYYRFKHLLGNEEDYRNAGLRMTSLARPVLGKAIFEALAFTVSVINGCQSCVRAHEAALKQHQFTVDQIHDLARLAAVVKGMEGLARADDQRV